ncbi:MAG: fructosamine kinase family protein [Lachnospiraceae bacterium]|nr:fructosamine kinase family protein [Lachnospiraceae bacterium]
MTKIREYGSLDEAVRDIFGSGRKTAVKKPVCGGDINDACAVTLDDGTVIFMKTNTSSAISNFRAEAAGLDCIRGTGTIRCPQVLAAGTDHGSAFLLMEFIAGAPRIRDYWETFAAELAAMHKAKTAEKDALFGFGSDNYIGSSVQINARRGTWTDFFRDCRLGPQFRSAMEYFDGEDRKRITRLLSNLDKYLTEPERPALLHGDLWSGNVITGPDGKAWLIDPAVYYGHPEADIAMTELFGGFPSVFYQAYRSAAGLSPDYPERRDLYNLYQLLNHLNLFGSMYLSSVRSILRRY